MKHVLLEDESLRDGLQFEKKILPLEEKLKIVAMLIDAGVKRIQVGSFVHPERVPQMADTDEFISNLPTREDVLFTGLVLNDKGLERALKSKLRHISLSVSVSDTHSMKNVRKTHKDALRSVTMLISNAVKAGVTVRAGAQCAFGCVYEGEIAQTSVMETIMSMVEAGAQEINLADTTGMANPKQVKTLVTKVNQISPGTTLSLHLHDTRGLAIANMMAGYEAGVTIFDTSVGGLGGCPFVKGAAGNIATEDAVNLFQAMGVETGIDIKRLCKITEYYETVLERRLPGKMSRVLHVMKEKHEKSC